MDKKRSVLVNGRKTSITVEATFWSALREIAIARGQTMNAIISEIDRSRTERTLSSAVRVWLLEHFQSLAAPRATRAA